VNIYNFILPFLLQFLLNKFLVHKYFKITFKMDLQREEGSVSTPVLSFPRQASKIIKLKKEVRLLEAVAITVGSIIGSGIQQN